MNKVDIIAKVAEKAEITKKDSKEIVDLVFDTIVEGLVAGDTVDVAKFGKFSIKEVAAREARNPQTGDTVMVAAHKAPKFAFSSTLKKAVR